MPQRRRPVPRSERGLYALPSPWKAQPSKPEPPPKPELEPVELLGGPCETGQHVACHGWWPVGVVVAVVGGHAARPAKCTCWCHYPGGGA